MSTNTKPLSEWTLGELKEHCTKEGDCKNPTVCRFFNSEEGGCSISHDTPNLWDLTEKPRFTEDEAATMRVLYAGVGYAVLARDESGCLCAFCCKPIWAGKEWIASPEDGGARWESLPRELFAGLLPGQYVTIADVIGQKENRPG